MGLRVAAPALLVCLGAVLLAATGRALVVDDFESGGFALATGCRPPPGSYLTNVETGLAGALGGRRSTFLTPMGPLPVPCPAASETEELTFVTAELVTGAQDDGVLFEVTNNITATNDVGAYFVLTYQLPDSTAFDLTDGGASDTLQIAFAEVGGPFVLRISAGYQFGARGYGRFDFDSPAFSASLSSRCSTKLPSNPGPPAQVSVPIFRGSNFSPWICSRHRGRWTSGCGFRMSAACPSPRPQHC